MANFGKPRSLAEAWRVSVADEPGIDTDDSDPQQLFYAGAMAVLAMTVHYLRDHPDLPVDKALEAFCDLITAEVHEYLEE